MLPIVEEAKTKLYIIHTTLMFGGGGYKREQG
jgi:hypothetical protein